MKIKVLSRSKKRKCVRKKQPRVVWVNSWRDIKGANSSVHGHVLGNTIHAIKGSSTKADVEHEKAHIILGHKFEDPPTPEQFAREELAATKYAFDRIGHPRHIRQQLRAIYNDMAVNIYKIQPIRAHRILEAELRKIKPPAEWLEDFAKEKIAFNKQKKSLEKGFREWLEAKSKKS